MYSDDLSLKLIEEEGTATLVVGLQCSRARVIRDFALGAFYKLHLEHLLDAASTECWFTYPRPQDISIHERVFSGCPLHFNAPFDGFTLARQALDVPLAMADPPLHALHYEVLKRSRRTVGVTSLAIRVRGSVATVLWRGVPSAESIAQGLRFSRRTLARKLYRMERVTVRNAVL